MLSIQKIKNAYTRVKDVIKRVFTKETGQRILGFLLLRLQEPSTWRGIVLALTASGTWGYADTPEKATMFITFGMLAAGLVGMVFPDAVKKAETVDRSRSGGFSGFRTFGPGDGNQIVDTPDDDDEAASPVSKRAPRK